jgi:ribonuclease P protein component
MGLAHITKRRDFKAAAETGRRFRAFACTVQLRERPLPDAPPLEPASPAVSGIDPQICLRPGLRLGLTASRHTGTATERNRIRRRLRAAAETAYGPFDTAPLDVVIVARREVLGARFVKLVSDLSRSLTEARAKTASTPHQTRSRQDHAKRR